MLTRVMAIAAVLIAATAGCGDTGAPPSAGSSGTGDRTLTVFAAASLTESFTALGRTFESTRPGVKVRFNFGGSSTLAQQIVQGAPVDVFAAASPATMKTVWDDGLVGPGGTPVFARNRLVIAVPVGGSGQVRTLRDLAGPGLKVVLCAPRVPCGAAAEKALDAGGVKVRAVSQEQDVKAVLTKVSMGEADAGLVYRSDAKAAAGRVLGIEFPESAQAINDYPVAVLKEAPQRALAEQFVALVRSPQGRTVLTQAGFEA
jgi:molybdate transport system substrate-binding protein